MLTAARRSMKCGIVRSRTRNRRQHVRTLARWLFERVRSVAKRSKFARSKLSAVGGGHVRSPVLRSWRRDQTKREVLNPNWKGGVPKTEKNKRYVAKHPEKHAAHLAMTAAIRRGELVRQPCEVCGNPKTDGHHDDYSKPLDVRWLCRVHHLEHHKSGTQAPPVDTRKDRHKPGYMRDYMRKRRAKH